MNDHDLDWITAERPAGPVPDPGARERALHALRGHIASAGEPHRARRRLPRPARLLSLAVAGGAAAALAALVVSAGDHTAKSLDPGIPPRLAIHHTVRHGARSPLVQLAADVGASPAPTGDATLVQRTTHSAGQDVTVYDLYADDGRYFFSPTLAGLPDQVSGGHTGGGGLFAREVAAARLAATGDVRTAAEQLAEAPDPGHAIPLSTRTGPAGMAAARAKAKAMGQPVPHIVGTLFDNWAWENAQDAIIAGSGDPQVRAGVLRILAMLPGVSVTHGTTDGQPTLVLRSGAEEVGEGYSEALTINADTGVPIEFVGGPPSGPPAATVDYSVSRVSLSSLPSVWGGR